MTPQRTVFAAAACVVTSLSIAACSSDRGTSASTLSALTTTTTTTIAPTTIAPTTVAPTTVPATTSTTAVPTTTTEAPTTTTVPPGSLLALRSDGVGDARFGARPDDVINYVTKVIGPQTSDSGWVDAPTRRCPGTVVRFVAWGDLNLYFSDSSQVSPASKAFFSWALGPANGTSIVPAGMKTLDGIGIGSTVAQLRSKYPAARIFAGDSAGTGSSTLTQDLYAFLNGSDDASVIIELTGGQGCNHNPTPTTDQTTPSTTEETTPATTG